MRLSFLHESGGPWYGQWVVVWGAWSGHVREAGKVKDYNPETKIVEIAVAYPPERAGNRSFMQVGRRGKWATHLYMASNEADAMRVAKAGGGRIDTNPPDDPADWWKR